MNLVWNEYLTFLKDKDVDIDKYNLKESYYWLDNQIIKAYDTEGKLHKILRLHIDDDLNITVTDYKKEKNEFKIESWQDTINKNKRKLEQLELNSLKLIQDAKDKYKDYEKVILSSTGKDSMLVLYLTRMLCNNAKMIFNNTTLDCADTYKFVKTIYNTKIVTHKEGFYQLKNILIMHVKNVVKRLNLKKY